ISARLVRFASVLVGHVRGGLAHVVIVATIFFSGVSGSSAADTAAIGSIMIPSMVRRGYPRPLATAIVAAAGGMGVNIPPCIIMVLYGVAANASIGYLFAAGFLPGFLSGLSLMVMVYFTAKRQGLPKEVKASLRQMLKAAWDAIPPLFMPVIILGGILTGVFTATESAVIAVVYGAFLSMVVYRELRLRDVPRILVSSAKLTGMVMLVVGMSITFAWIVSIERVPHMVTEWMLSVSRNPMVFLFFVNILMLIVGMFLDATPAMITFTPILYPIANQLGIDPVHFGIVMVTNLGVGFVHPPVGSCLNVATAIGEITIDEVIRPILPFIGVMIVALLLITYWPGMTLFIPRMLGYKG
ncbi:MAG TPA: TRAP transporter large permease, partial [Thermodesulfobacteriota bacterium]|nr:TRAP transporter large permease [Thermodesulfobacteriota bacterium]